MSTTYSCYCSVAPIYILCTSINTLNLSFYKESFIDYCYSLLVTLLYFGAVDRMATYPVVLPEVFNREWSLHQLVFHFENVAAVNEWNEDSCLCWMKVGLLAQHTQHFRDSHKKSLQTNRGQMKLFRNDLSDLANGSVHTRTME